MFTENSGKTLSQACIRHDFLSGTYSGLTLFIPLLRLYASLVLTGANGNDGGFERIYYIFIKQHKS
jgi:hypothetical protein